MDTEIELLGELLRTERRAEAAEAALATARAEQIKLLQTVSILTNERDEARARNAT